MSGTTPEGLPYPSGTDPVRDGDNAIAALAAATGTTMVFPVNTSAQPVARVGMMLAAALIATFDAGGRYILNVSATFSSVLYAHAASGTYPVVFSVTDVTPSALQFFAQLPNGANVTGPLTLRLMIIGVRK
jgi:hypothetical protein